MKVTHHYNEQGELTHASTPWYNVLSEAACAGVAFAVLMGVILLVCAVMR